MKKSFSPIAWVLAGVGLITWFTRTAAGREAWQAIRETFGLTRDYIRRYSRLFWPVKLGEAGLAFIFYLQGMYPAATFFAILTVLEFFAATLILGQIAGQDNILTKAMKRVAVVMYIVILLP